MKSDAKCDDFAVSVVGRDGPGIIAAIAEAMLRLDCNLADTSMSVLNGHFAMVLIVQVPGKDPSAAKREKLTQVLLAGTRQFELMFSVAELDENNGQPAAGPRGNQFGIIHDRALITVYGADQPGIVYAVAAAVARTRANITDLRTQRTGPDNQALYALFLEVDLPANVSKTDLNHELRDLPQRLGIELTIQDVAAMEL